ncbi:MAG: M13 family metallopeptidase [Acidobacteria bacterium]|nr:M13 family metallopeptidase [Acidobacteriota bacterium]
MRFFNTFVFCLLCLGIAAGQSAPSDEKVLNTRFDPNLIDKNLDPCTDFYAYACAKWRAKNPIPGDEASWGRFDELVKNGELTVRSILEKYSAANAGRSGVEQKIGDYYASCMDESAIEKAGTAPLQDPLKAIANLKTKKELAGLLVGLHRQGVNVLFSFSSDQDFKDATQVIAEVDQGGMGLPDRDYYFKDDAKSADLRKKYVAHVQKMFELLGDSGPQATEAAQTVLKVETALAKGALDVTSRRDPSKLYHRMPAKQLAALNPGFNWDIYLRRIGAPDASTLNVTVPDFFKQLDSVLQATSLNDWKIYLRWHLVHAQARLLPARFVNENFNFYSKELSGTQELPPRWKRCVRYTTNDLGEAVGEKYVEETFGVEGKQRTLKMVRALETALGEDIRTLPWMGEETKKQAQEKLAAIGNRIGYPDKWRDYSRLNIVRGEALGNWNRSNEFEFQRQLNKIGQPVDKNEWPYPPSTVNASYNPQLNNITFPAGILQPPFYDNQADDAINFGAIGVVIGHELTHGFDDQGSQFDAKGNLRDWWTAQDKKEFETRTQCIADQYGSYTAIEDVKLNGKLTLGENVADNGGMRIAYMALMSTLQGKNTAEIDGFTPQQRFFLGFAGVWCENTSDAFQRLLANVDPHSPGQWRVNGTVSNMPEFREAFHCKADAPMVRQNACRAW